MESAAIPLVSRRLLKRTTSRCPVCRRPCPAEVWQEAGHPARVVMRRTCPEHGEAGAVIASDARFYWLSTGSPENAGGGCCGGGACRASDGATVAPLGRNAVRAPQAAFDTLSTCIALIEVVRSCNLACPVCYADSPQGAGTAVDAVPLAELQARIQGVVDRKGGIEILQLSGGEPTLHPELDALLRWVRDHDGIDYVLLNTNGVRLARDPGFAESVGEVFRGGGLQVYLQFDGTGAEGQAELRGADLRALRREAIANCARAGLPVTLAMTVTPSNLGTAWDTVAFGLSQPHVHGVTFQPMVGSGRLSAPTGVGGGRLTSADVLLALVAQSGGRMGTRDFTPLPCGDPNCAVIGYLLRVGGQVRSLGEFVDFAGLQGFLHDRLQYRLDDLARCGCENEPLGELLKRTELGPSAAFRIMVKPFMDAWSWDQDRIDRCCTHVIRPDGKLDSFCRYYSGFPDCTPAPA